MWYSLSLLLLLGGILLQQHNILLTINELLFLFRIRINWLQPRSIASLQMKRSRQGRDSSSTRGKALLLLKSQGSNRDQEQVPGCAQTILLCSTTAVRYRFASRGPPPKSAEPRRRLGLHGNELPRDPDLLMYVLLHCADRGCVCAHACV